jgi:membrane protease YdiL (CAAX protease family)
MKDKYYILKYISIYAISGAFSFFVDYFFIKIFNGNFLNDFYGVKCIEIILFILFSLFLMGRNFISAVLEFRVVEFVRPMAFAMLPILLFFGTGIFIFLIFNLDTSSGGARPVVGLHSGYIFVMVILAPFYEELLFRGILFSFLQKNMSDVLSVIMSSVLFTLSHFSRSPVQQNAVIFFSFIFVTGCYYCYLKIKFRSLAPGFVTHASFNFICALVNPGGAISN